MMTPPAIVLLASLLPALAQTDWAVAKTFQIGGQGGWDYLTVDPATHRLYVPRGTHTMVIDSEFQVPPGNYLVSAEPLSGAVQPGNLYLTTADTVDTALQPGIAGGFDTPAILSVTAGSEVTSDLSVAAGASSLKIQSTTLGPPGGQGESLLFYTGPRMVQSGEPVDLLVAGLGLDANLTDRNVRIAGPGITVRPNSVRIDPGMSVNGLPVLRITLDVESRLSTASATLVISKDGNTAVLSGGLVINPAQ